jgi:hypothetical protein
MMVVKKYRQPVSSDRIERNRRFEKFFLHLARQIGPKSKCCAAQKSLKLSGVIHFFYPKVAAKHKPLPVSADRGNAYIKENGASKQAVF